jgi:outer membrane protein
MRARHAAVAAATALLLAAGSARAAPPPQANAPAPPPAATGWAPPRVQPARAIERVTFADAVRRASARSTATVIALEEVRRARALLGEVRSAALPSVTGQASYTRLSSRNVVAFTPGPAGGGLNGTLVAADANQEAASASLQIPIFAPSRWLAWGRADEAVEVARASEVDVQRTTVLTAARAFLAILAQRRVVDVSRSATDIARARFDFAHARRSGGIGNAVDELRAEQQLATSQVQLANGEVGLVRAQEALGVLAGADGPLDAAEDPALDAPAATSPDAAVEERADVRAARSRLDAAAHLEKDSWADWLPTLVATAQASYQNPSSATLPQTGWQVQFLLTVPIYEGGLRVAQLHERAALTREARAALEGTLRQARSDVRLAVEEVQREEEALGSARLAAVRARSVLDLQTEAYRAGAANDLDVTTAQQQSRDADLAAVIAEDGVRQARLDLLSALGQFP